MKGLLCLQLICKCKGFYTITCLVGLGHPQKTDYIVLTVKLSTLFNFIGKFITDSVTSAKMFFYSMDIALF